MPSDDPIPQRSAPSEAPVYLIESVDRALALMLAFEEREVMTISEAGVLLGVSRSTAYRLLGVLEHRGFVRQDGRTKAFHRGASLLRVGLAAVRRSDVRAAARPLLERVVAVVDETAHLIVLQGRDAFFLDCVEGTRMVRATPRTGTAIPAHCSSGGKLLLAGLADPELDALLSGAPLVALTPRSLKSEAEVREAVVAARERGWAVNDGESEEGLRAVSVLADGLGATFGTPIAITVSGPAARMPLERLSDIVTVMREASAAEAELTR